MNHSCFGIEHVSCRQLYRRLTIFPVEIDERNPDCAIDEILRMSLVHDNARVIIAAPSAQKKKLSHSGGEPMS